MTVGPDDRVLHVLDTTVLIDYLRGRPVVQRVQRLHSRGDLVTTTAINIEEIVRGLRSTEIDAARHLTHGMTVLPIGPREAWLAGTWRRDYAARGVTLWQADCLVAAAAAAAGAVVITGNPKDFPLPEVSVVNWPVNE